MYYIDVGAADLVADGKVKLASGQVDHLTESSVVLEDGTELPADLVVYATGYRSMNGWVAQLMSQEMADRVGKVWGLGSDTPKDPGPWEGEERNMWKPTQQPRLWFHGGNLHQSRYYSLLQRRVRHESPGRSKLPVGARRETWATVADVCVAAVSGLDDPVHRWLVRQLLQYLEEEGLSQSSLTPDDINVLPAGIRASRSHSS